MHKRMILFAAIASALFLASCDEERGQEVDPKSNDYLFNSGGIGGVYLWKDPTTNCIYYYRNAGHRGGLTIKYKSDGTPDCPGK